MGNPFTIAPFNCCTCPEPPDYEEGVDDPLATYINLCGCPAVAVVCASEGKTATLCGFSEFEGGGVSASSPPKKYTRQTKNKTSSFVQYSCNTACSPEKVLKKKNDTTTAFFKQEDYDLTDCSIDVTTLTEGVIEAKTYTTSAPSCGSLLSTTYGSILDFTISGNVVSTTYQELIESTNDPCFSGGACAGSDCLIFLQNSNVSLSNEDTETDALDRETATTGASCSSLYQLRTTSFSFTHRTVEYTATASNLVVGVEYEGCVRIRRREAYSGTAPVDADTAWHDVAPDTIAAFTATAAEKEVATDVALPIAQGYEYEVVGAYVWPTSAGCDCPTSYTAP